MPKEYSKRAGAHFGRGMGVFHVASDRFNNTVRHMKLCPIFLVLLIGATSAIASDLETLCEAIKPVLPSKEWTIKLSTNELVILGPKILILNPVNLPGAVDEELWRKYSIKERFEMTVRKQNHLSPQDVDELRLLRDRFYEITKRRGVVVHRGNEDVTEFGYVRLPEYQSSSASFFVKRNVEGQIVRPASIKEVVGKIDKVVESTFDKIPSNILKTKEANKAPVPTPTTVTPADDAPVASATGAVEL
jgi:hypothetical protein